MTEKPPCPEGHTGDVQMEWDGSRAQYLCTTCQKFWGPEGLTPPADWNPWGAADD